MSFFGTYRCWHRSCMYYDTRSEIGSRFGFYVTGGNGFGSGSVEESISSWSNPKSDSRPSGVSGQSAWRQIRGRKDLRMGGGAEEEKRTDMTSGEEGKQLVRTNSLLPVSVCSGVTKRLIFQNERRIGPPLKSVVPQLKEFQPKKEAQDGPPPPPDGGWGWIIVAASFLCNMVRFIHYSFVLTMYPNSGPGWHWLFLWDLCQAFGGALWRSWERQDLIGENSPSASFDNVSSLQSGWKHPGWLHYAGRTYILRYGEQVWTPINMHR